ncbi:MAG: hypothetical protein K1X64_20335 [Myxococcaceae bacterium]|nr:hypothetical protein [Myxococcaceae bacterium]
MGDVVSRAALPLQKLSDTTVLIPAAGRVPEGILALSNVQSPAMIPVAGRPVIHWTLSYLRSLGLHRFVIAVAKRGGFIEEFVDAVFGGSCEIQFITPSKSGGLGQTVLDLAHQVKTERALVVLGDTHFQLADPAVLAAPTPTVLVAPVEESYRWCVAQCAADGTVSALHDKKADLPGPHLALIGVYAFPSGAQLLDASHAAVAAADEQGKNAEMSAILEHLRLRAGLRAVPAGDWLDCGNPDSQAASHQALLQKRAFNELTIDGVMGTITKRSQNVEKFIDEINYLKLLPAELAVLFPRVVDQSVEQGNPHVTLEYYGYPTLGEAFVFENIDAGIWERVFEHLRHIVTQAFMAQERPLKRGALVEMCIDKTRARLAALPGPEPLLTLVRHERTLTLNGRTVKNLPLLWPRITAEVERMAAQGKGSVIHGDLCFSNVLYDFRSRICKLIDPRGSFAERGVAGDIRYDVAKLYHSARGKYDFLTHDLFHVDVQGTDITFNVRSQPSHERILERFEKVFFGPFDKRDITVVTALLFASMLPLHYDYPKRQLAMYATALGLLDEVLS